MIQTLAKHSVFIVPTTGRNPVFALEMIQTPENLERFRLYILASQSSIRPGDDSDMPWIHFSRLEPDDVAIQYSPWR